MKLIILLLNFTKNFANNYLSVLSQLGINYVEIGFKKIIKSKLSLIGSVLGIFQDESFNKISNDIKNKVEDLISKRNHAKIEKNFDLADSIRDELAELGIEIKDTSDGTSWNVKS